MDTERKEGFQFDIGGILENIQEKLRERGIDIDVSGNMSMCCDGENGPKVKIVCVAPGLKESVEEMGKSSRDRVVMVRIDAETSESLDAWVETGAVKSRSEAAALFIREGLGVRKAELDQLRDALKDVEKAREKLKNKAREVFGNGD